MNSASRLAVATAIAVLLTLVLASLAGAVDLASYSADYNVLSDRALVKAMLVLTQKVSAFDWNLPEDAADVAVDGLSFNVVDMKSFKRLQVQGTQFDTVTFTYSTSSVLEKTSDSFFILDLASIGSIKRSITVRLPDEATLKYSLDSAQASIIPKTSDVRTDGKRLIISWNETSLASGTAILVIYREPGKSNSPVAAVAAGVLLLVGISIAFYRRRKAGIVVPATVAGKAAPAGTSGNSDLTRNLFEDEKKVVELLMGSGEEGMWQKQLEIKSGISKVKLSRKLRGLDQKGLIEKIPYGNANKIRLKKA